MPPFASSEHEALGNNITIPSFGSSYLFTLNNGVALTFGQLIALAGDFYGVPEQPISLGSTEEDRDKRFLAAFNTLNNANPKDVCKILEMISKEKKDIDDAMAKGHPADNALDERALKDTLNSIEYTKQKYVLLAKNNVDHFSETAISAYKTGHLLAIHTAVNASKLTDDKQKMKALSLAFAYEGFACHFLTDLFAAGHMRIPRKALYEQFGVDTGALLSLFQHNEDGKNGLNVINLFDESWKAFGDGQLFEKPNEENKKKAENAVNAGIQEVYQAFLNQALLGADQMTVLKHIPIIDDNNVSPLFKLSNENEILYRKQLSVLNSTNYQALSKDQLFFIFDYFTKEYLEDSSIIKKIEKQLSIITNGAHRFFSPPAKKENDFHILNRKTCQCTLF